MIKNKTNKNKSISKSTKRLNWFANFSFWWGLLYTIVFILAVIADPKVLFGDGVFWSSLFSAFFVSILPLGAGIFLRKKVRKLIEIENLVNMEKIVLNIAERNKGFVTPALVSVKASVSTDEASEAIENLVVKGLLIPFVSDEGAVVFKCADFLNISKN